MLAVWTHYGRPPKHQDMSKEPAIVGPKAYIRRFGTWRKALAAFVDRGSRDDDPNPDAGLDLQQPVPALSDAAVKEAKRVDIAVPEDRRDIPLGLRFRVLNRDRFRCVLCGDSPSGNLQCKLRVDHIVPWSRGGKTRDDNLRSLCEPCNLGRGNRFSG
jgi:hypothetical protein